MRKHKWSGEKLSDLVHLTYEEFNSKYKINKNRWYATRRYWINKIKTGETPMPPSPEQYPKPEETEARTPEQLEQLANVFQQHGVDLTAEDLSQATRAGFHVGYIRNSEGEIEYTKPLPHVDFGRGEAQGDQEFISQAPPVEIHPITVIKSERTDTLTLLGGDAQIGFRGEEPFHDEDAMGLFLMAALDLQPDNVILTGDMIDLPNMSSFEQRDDWRSSTQAAIDRYSAFLAQLRVNCPEAKIVVVHGNHEARMDKYIRKDAAALLGLKRANADRELPVLTLSYLVRYEELGIEMVDGYPNAAYWLEDNMKVTHGTNVKKGGSNANKYLNEEDETTFYGHTHRVEVAYRTIATRLGHRMIAAASPGCLARIDGYVPGYRYSVDALGNTVPRAEDWQNGLLVVRHTPERHDITQVVMQNGEMMIDGKVYSIREEK